MPVATWVNVSRGGRPRLFGPQQVVVPSSWTPQRIRVADADLPEHHARWRAGVALHRRVQGDRAEEGRADADLAEGAGSAVSETARARHRRVRAKRAAVPSPTLTCTNVPVGGVSPLAPQQATVPPVRIAQVSAVPTLIEARPGVAALPVSPETDERGASAAAEPAVPSDDEAGDRAETTASSATRRRIADKSPSAQSGGGAQRRAHLVETGRTIPRVRRLLATETIKPRSN